MDGRSAILGKIRRALGEGGRDPHIQRDLVAPPLGIIPARGQLEGEARVLLFERLALKSLATVERVEALGNVPEAIGDYLRRRNLPLALRIGDDSVLTTLPWVREPLLAVERGASSGDDMVGVSRAYGGVAESGTVVLLSGPQNPTTLNFLPETHVVVIEADRILSDYESVWRALRNEYGPGRLPRTVNFITGPSRSGDIEQKLELGAHGPKHLHLLLVGAAAEAQA